MPLVPAICTQCGAQIEVDNTHEAGVCKFCGTAFITEKAINNYVSHITNNIKDSVVYIQGNGADCELQQLLKRAEGLAKIEEIDKARKIYEEIMDKYPDDYRGYLGAINCYSKDSYFLKICIETIKKLGKIQVPKHINVDEQIKKAFGTIFSTRGGSVSFNILLEDWNVILHYMGGEIATAHVEGKNYLKKIVQEQSSEEYFINKFFDRYYCSNAIDKEEVINEQFFSVGHTETKININKEYTKLMLPCIIGNRVFLYYELKESMGMFIGNNVVCHFINDFEACLETLKIEKSKITNIKKSSEKNNDSAACYIATCVYGSYDCPEVWTLRRFRDYTLDETWYGRLFIKCYYATSPTLVKRFGNQKWFKTFWKNHLDCMVSKLNQQGIEDIKYTDKY